MDIIEDVDPISDFKDDVLFVALGKNVKESETLLMWAFNNNSTARWKSLCILHVHQPPNKIPILGTKLPIIMLEDNQVKAYREKERLKMHNILNSYIQTCNRAGVRADKLCIEMESIEKGIVKLIFEHGIKWLVMGAAANKSYSRKMKEPKSKKAIHVRRESPIFCHIWFICKGNLICTRESKVSGVNIDAESPLSQASKKTESIQSLRSLSAAGEEAQIKNRGSSLDCHHEKQLSAASNGSGSVSVQNSSIPEGNIDWDNLSRRSPSVVSHNSTSSFSEIIEDFTLSETGDLNPLLSSAASSPIERNTNGELYDRLKKYVVEAEDSHREAYEESLRRKKAEKDAIDAIRRASSSKTMYTEELKRRREMEAALAKGSEEVENMKRKLGEVMQELRAAQEHKSSFECQIADSDNMVEELKQKILSVVKLMEINKKERDELQFEHENALRLVEELKEKHALEASNSCVPPQFFSEFFFFEIEEATRNFSQALKIGEGVYGSIYRGHLRYTQVAIKVLHPNNLQGPPEFQQEVNILSKLRHPNIVTLIGACPENWALIYEYLPNGSLEDRLNCKDNTPPLSWQSRIRIAAELCSALIFLQYCQPQGIIHGDLRPSNILLDDNFVSKLSNFGISRVLPQDELLCWISDQKVTSAYMDPEFFETGELTSKSDVYSFGIILLRLLTGRPAEGIIQEVQYALDKENLKDLLDPTAGDWPFVQGQQLAHLAIHCCDMSSSCRPDLATEVWRLLQPMRASSGVLSSLRFDSEERLQAPSYFVCPIFQEIMQDPVVAADGFTYEAEALKGWLDSGRDTSPMTNLQLPNTNLVQNHALRSAIQEWLQQQQN